MKPSVPTWVLAIVWASIFLGFLAGVIMRPSIETVMAGGAAALVLLKIAYDYLYLGDEEDVAEMFE